MPSRGIFAIAVNFVQSIETATYSTAAKFLSPWFKLGETGKQVYRGLLRFGWDGLHSD